LNGASEGADVAATSGGWLLDMLRRARALRQAPCRGCPGPRFGLCCGSLFVGGAPRSMGAQERTGPSRHLITFLIVAGLLVLFLYRGGCGQGEQTGIPEDARIVEGKVGRHVVRAEVADTRALRLKGLSGRRQLAPGYGMLFIFEEPDRYDFWMKDTTVPLSIAFVRGDGTIVAIRQMEPESLRRVSPPEPVKYALEVRRGWFRERGIEEGMVLELPDRIPPPPAQGEAAAQPAGQSPEGEQGGQ